MLSDMVSGILSGIYSDSLFDILSDLYSDILFVIFLHSIHDVLFKLFNSTDYFTFYLTSSIRHSDTLTCIFTCILTFYPTCFGGILAFYFA